MCFAKRRQQSKQSRTEFQRLYALRIKYTEENDLSQFFLCTLQFMEETIRKFGLSRHFSFNLFGKNYHHNVNAQFQETFYKMSDKEQLFFYQHIINILINDRKVDMKKLEDPEYEFQFDAQVQKWVSNTIVSIKVEGSRFLIIAEGMDFDLRNYWLRKSKSKSDHYILSAITTTKMPNLRFKIDEPNQKGNQQLREKLQFIRQQALVELVREWIVPIKKIQVETLKPTYLDNKKSSIKNSQIPLFQNFNQNQKDAINQSKTNKIKEFDWSSIAQIDQETPPKKQRSVINQKPILTEKQQIALLQQNQDKKQNEDKEIALTDLLELTTFELKNKDKKYAQVELKKISEKQDLQSSELSISKFGNLQCLSGTQENKSQTEFYTMKENSVRNF